jgi:hypothetical protein
MSPRSLTSEEIIALARASGLDMKPEYMEELVIAHHKIHKMIERMPRGRARGDEPAHAFSPDRMMPSDEG